MCGRFGEIGRIFGKFPGILKNISAHQKRCRSDRWISKKLYEYLLGNIGIESIDRADYEPPEGLNSACLKSSDDDTPDKLMRDPPFITTTWFHSISEKPCNARG